MEKSENVLLKFPKPDKAIFLAIRRLIEGLAIAPSSRRASESSSATKCGLEETLKRIEAHLLHDYSEHQAEINDAPYQVDYVVTQEKAGQLEILTRLFKDEKSGNIFYGPTVRRLSNDIFLLTE